MAVTPLVTTVILSTSSRSDYKKVIFVLNREASIYKDRGVDDLIDSTAFAAGLLQQQQT